MNFLYHIYFALPNFARIGIAGKAINRVLGMILKRIFDAFIPAYLLRTAPNAGYGLNSEPRDETYIVSLTSFPARINEIWITIETLLRQSFKPDKIILWLAKSQFPDEKVPESLEKLKNRGLTINFCDEDFRSHKKYLFSMKIFPQSNIITFDDDVYYPSNTLFDIVKLHLKYPNTICANRAHKITFNKLGGIKKYSKWKHNYKGLEIPSHLLTQVGVGGVLYPSSSLHEEVFNSIVFKDICFHADDLWLKVMALKKGTKIVTNKRYNKDFITITTSQREKLVNNNVFGGGNDEQMKKILQHYELDLNLILNC